MPAPVYQEDLPIACYQNPVLGLDAWSNVEKWYPAGDGAKASVVCRFACKMRDQCPFGEQGTEVVANGGGWFTHRGVFIKPPDDMIEVNQAAAYIGITVHYFEILIRTLGLQRIKSPLSNYVTYVRFSDVEDVAQNHGPRHGTMARYELHQLRGEVPCHRCRTFYDAEVHDEGVLRRRVR